MDHAILINGVAWKIAFHVMKMMSVENVKQDTQHKKHSAYFKAEFIRIVISQELMIAQFVSSDITMMEINAWKVNGTQLLEIERTET